MNDDLTSSALSGAEVGSPARGETTAGDETKSNRPAARPTSVVVTGCLTILLLVAAYGISVARFGSLASTLAYLRGARLIPDRQQCSVGPLRVGEKKVVSFRVRNFGARPGVIDD